MTTSLSEPARIGFGLRRSARQAGVSPASSVGTAGSAASPDMALPALNVPGTRSGRTEGAQPMTEPTTPVDEPVEDDSTEAEPLADEAAA